MAEIGFTASIVAVIQITGTVISLSYGYVSGVKRAPNDLRELVDELYSLSKVLNTLQDFADKNAKSTHNALGELGDKGGPLRACALELRQLQLKLEPKEGFKGVMASLAWPLKEKETMQHISRIERFKSLFMFALAADQISISKIIEEHTGNTNRTVQEIEKYVRNTNFTVQGLHAWSAVQDTRRSEDDTVRCEEKRKKVLDWLYPKSSEERHLQITRRRQKNTGKWLLQAQGFRVWIDLGFSILWGYGIHSSVVIDHLEAGAQAANYGVAYVYFDYKEQGQSPVQVLCNIIKQLAMRLPRLHMEIEELHNKLDSERKRPTLEDLLPLLLKLSTSFVRVFLVLDALDECDPDQRTELLPILQNLGAGNNNISLFLTSRPHPEDIQDALHDSLKIELSAKDDDIMAYVEERIQKGPRMKRLVERAKCKDRIINELVACAKGMFLLVHFHVEYLCQQTTPKQILIALDSFRSSSTRERPLDPTYDRAMNSIRNNHHSSTELAFNILAWLVKAGRALTADEIRVAVSIQMNRYELDELDLPDKTTLIDVCAGLVTLDEDTGIVRLAHYTVQEYLLRNWIIPQDANNKLALTCITFLTFDDLSKGACGCPTSLRDRLESNPFLGYAAHNLSFHIKASDELSTVHAFLTFLKRSGCISSYMQVIKLRKVYGGRFVYFDQFPKGLSPLHVASAVGHSVVVNLIIGEGVDLSLQDSRSLTALHLAASEGHELIVRLLLQAGAPVDTPDQFGSTPLFQAARQGHEVIVRILLENGADVTATDSQGETALHSAAAEGHTSSAYLLLKNGANVSAVSRLDMRTALHDAAVSGHVEVAQLLLEKGASISAITDENRTPLHFAAWAGREMMVQLLLAKGADYLFADIDGRTTLHKAACQGHKEIVWMLLQIGASITARDHDRHTALDDAVDGEHWDVARLLLENGSPADHSTAQRLASFAWTS